MFCPKCGAQLPDGSRFCASCGSQIGGAPAPAAAPQAGYVPPVQPIKPSIAVSGLATNDLGMLVSVVAAFVGIVAFFMPIISLSVFGSTTTLSAMQMTFGATVYGMSMDGEFANILFLVIPVIALVVSLLVKGKPGAIARIVVAVVLLGFVFALFLYSFFILLFATEVSHALGLWISVPARLASSSAMKTSWTQSST